MAGTAEDPPQYEELDFPKQSDERKTETTSRCPCDKKRIIIAALVAIIIILVVILAIGFLIRDSGNDSNEGTH